MEIPRVIHLNLFPLSSQHAGKADISRKRDEVPNVNKEFTYFFDKQN